MNFNEIFNKLLYKSKNLNWLINESAFMKFMMHQVSE